MLEKNEICGVSKWRLMVLHKKRLLIGVVATFCLLSLVIGIVVKGTKNNVEQCFIPKSALFATDEGASSFIDEMESANEDKQYFTEIKEDEAGNIVVSLTEEQKENAKELLDESISKVLDLISDEAIEIEVSEDHKELAWKGTAETQMNGSSVAGACVYYMGLYQCMCEDAGEDWSVNVTITNSETNKVVKEFSFPQDELQLDSEDWNK